MKKQANRLLSALLVLLMLFTLLPVASAAPSMSIVDASEEIDTWLKEQNQPEEEYDLDVEARTAATGDGFYRILHLDCGRKYFTPEWVKALINEMADAGYTHLQLAFGNDGLRFLLDDMNLDIDGDGKVEFTTDEVISGVESGNKTANSSGDSSYWTEAQMDDIIAHANKMGIEIIPLLNLPGHANAILDIPANDAYNYTYTSDGWFGSGLFAASYTSQNTLNIFNSEAKEFGLTILKKYVDYFAGKGCEFFNFGADEFANDTGSGTFSFSQLNASQYAQFVSFINEMAAYIKSKGMTPCAFNDGLYYNGQTANVDTDIQCSYWSSGWGSYPVAAASKISANGHKMINTHGDFYYVLGKSDAFDSGYSKAAEFSNTSFAGSTVSNPVGSTFCIWCDYPNAETEQVVAQKTRLVLRAMAARMQDKSIDSINTGVISGGFNADGSINKNEPVVPVTPVAFPESAGVAPSIKAGGTANYTLNASAKWTSSNENVLSLTVADITNAAVTASSVQATALTAGTATVTATLTDGTIYEAQVTVTSDSTDPTEPDLPGLPKEYIGEITAQEAGTKTTYVLDTNGIDTKVNYLIVAPSDAKALSYTYSNRQYSASTIDVELSADRKTIKANNIANNALWQFNSSSSTTIKNAYADVYVRNSSNIISTRSDTWDVINGGNGSYAFKSKSGSNYYLIYIENGSSFWRGYSRSYLRLYKETTETLEAGYWVTTEKLEDLIDYIGTLDSSLYTTDSWNKFSAALDDANSYITKYGNNSNAAFFTDKGPAVAAQANINTSALNLYNARQALVQDTTLTIEYWITNSRLKGTEYGLESCTVSTDREGIRSEQGVATVDLVDALGTKDGRTQEYWQTRVLDVLKRNNSSSGTELQSKMKGDDETQNGSAFTRIRYWEGKWQILTDTWIDVNLSTVTAANADDNGGKYTGPRHQLVAYYMEVLNIANAEGESELHANMADWGTKGDGKSSWGYNPESSRCSISIQVVYEDGSTNPESTTAANLRSKSFVYYLDYTSSIGRGIGTLMLSGGENYQIFKVTAETGDMTSTTSGNYVTITNLTWNDDAEVVWSGDATDTVTLANLSSNPNYDAPYDNLAWNKVAYNENNAILIRVYVKSIPKADSLTVHYIDQTVQPQAEFYTQSISVKSGTAFDPNFAFNPSYTNIDNALSNHTVTNYYNQTQAVQANLSKLTEIGASYRYSDYKLVNAVRKDDKNVYLYYTFNNKHVFVVDFGASVEITRSDIGVSEGDWTSATVTGAQYGTATVGVNQPLVYTPSQVMQNTEILTVTLANEKTTQATGQAAGDTYAQHRIYIIPASNVLYEETFFTQAAGKYTAWNQTAAATTTATQSADQNTLYGYDDIYATGTGNSMESSYVATLNQGDSTKDLTTTFTGTAFDLIGTCGRDTGYVYLKIVDAEGHGRAAVIDTSYSGDYGTLHQVPLAHLVMGPENKDYTVTVFGAYRKAATTTGNTASVMRARSYAADGLDAIYDRLADDGFAPDEVEYIYFDASSELAQMDNATFAALDMADAMTDGTVAPMASNTEGSRVEIDGFRVYRTTDTDNQYYSETEKDMTYARMLDMVNDNFTAYVENDGTGIWSLSNYEANGGPQNEIYLDKNDAVFLNVSGMTSLQITARVAGGKKNADSLTLLVNGIQVPIETSTEMYYNIDLTKVKSTLLTIRTNSNNVLLGLANVKYKGTLNTLSQEDIDEAIALLNSASVEPEPVEPEPTVFTPERFDADIHVTRAIFRKYVTVSVKTSLDVAYITVNGQRVDPINNRWFSWGANGTRSFTFRDTIGRNDSVAYEVIAYDADGNASEPIILH